MTNDPFDFSFDEFDIGDNDNETAFRDNEPEDIPEPDGTTSGTGDTDNIEEHANPDNNETTRTPSPANALTDADIERIFGEIVDHDYLDDITLSAAAQVIEAEAIVAKAEIEVQEKQNELDEISSQISELMQKVNKLKRAESEKRDELWDIKSHSRRIYRDIEEKKTVARTAYTNAKSQFMADLLSDKFEQIAKKQKWWQGIDVDGEQYRVLPHQWEAMRFIAAGKRVLLGDKMGLGKTLSALGALDISEIDKVLIITPADITGNFLDEISFWTEGRPAINIKGTTKIARRAMIEAMSFLKKFCVVVNYEAWRKDHALIQQLISVGFEALICDEAHTLKETNTSAYRGVQQIIITPNRCPNDNSVLAYDVAECPKCGWIKGSRWEHKAEKFDEAYWEIRTINTIVMMTGTFILNKPHDLYAPLSLIDPINFQNLNEFLRQYATVDYESGQFVFGPGGLDRLKLRLRGRLLSRNLEDAGIVLPPQKPIIHEVELDEAYSKQAEIIEHLNQYYEIVLDETRQMSVMAQIALITRLRQANVWPGGITLREGKYLSDGITPNPHAGEVIWAVGDEIRESVVLDKAVQLIKEFTAQGERVAVFSQFSTALHELQLRIMEAKNDEGGIISSVVFDGSTPKDLKDEVRHNFDKKNHEDKKWDCVLANYKSGGAGLNLTEATHTIVLDREWNPGKQDQAFGRTQRIGQDQTTFVHYIVIPNTIDAWMESINARKQRMIEGFDEGLAQDLKDELLTQLRSRHKRKAA